MASRTSAFINASGVDLDRVVVQGDLGRIVAGNSTTADDPGLNLLQVRTMGTPGLLTQGGAGNLTSIITGKLGALKVAGDFTDAYLGVSAVTSTDGQIGSVFIGGDLTGGVGDNSGVVVSTGAMGNVRIGGSLAGGAGGGSGFILGSGVMGDVHIAGDLVGGSVTGSASLFNSGEIVSSGRIASVTIGGSLIAGTDANTGTLGRRGAIVAGDDFGPVKIGGSLLGNCTNPALIIAKGQHVKPGIGFDVAIASLTVKGDVRFAEILAGFDLNQTPVNADASIGSVTVGHDWVASSLVAGAQDTGAAGFGVGDTLQAVGNTSLIAHIASITIKGDVTGSLAAGDNFGFVAQQIDKLRIGARVFTLKPGPSNDNIAVPFTDDVHLLEVL